MMKPLTVTEESHGSRDVSCESARSLDIRVDGFCFNILGKTWCNGMVLVEKGKWMSKAQLTMLGSLMAQ